MIEAAKVKVLDLARAGEKLVDPYELKARLLPGLLLLLPPILFLAVLYGPKNPLVVALVTVMSSCGGPYLLANFVRTRGLLAQERLLESWGALPSTLLLRHRDETLSAATKRRYHELIKLKLNVETPSADAEAEDPLKADEAYEAAADVLRPLTNNRKTFPFVFKELVGYGFNRNAYGSRWFGLLIATATACATLIHGGGWNLHMNLFGMDAPHMAVLCACFVHGALWSAHFTPRTVRLAGIAYAKRLCEALEVVPKQSRRVRKAAGDCV